MPKARGHMLALQAGALQIFGNVNAQLSYGKHSAYQKIRVFGIVILTVRTYAEAFQADPAMRK
jgi:hypothetical protein